MGLTVGHDVGHRGVFVQVLSFFPFAAQADVSASNAEDGLFAQQLFLGIECLKQHPVRMLGEENFRFPYDFHPVTQ